MRKVRLFENCGNSLLNAKYLGIKGKGNIRNV